MTYKHLILLLIGAVLLPGCARRIGQGQGNKLTSYSEDLSATRPVISIERPAQEEQVEEETQEQAYTAGTPKSENTRIDEALSKISAFNAGIKEAPGFRISVFAGNSKADFESARSYVMQHFPELELYESYSQPTYRLKVGDFMKRIDAERYYHSLMGRFDSAKITNETIDVQKGFRIN